MVNSSKGYSKFRNFNDKISLSSEGVEEAEEHSSDEEMKAFKNRMSVKPIAI